MLVYEMLQELLNSSKENDPSQISTNQEKQIPTVTNCHVQNTDDFEQCPMPPTYNTESTSNLDHSLTVKLDVAIQCNTMVKYYVSVSIQTCENKCVEKGVQFNESHYECKTTDTTADIQIDASSSVELEETADKLAESPLLVPEPQESPTSTDIDDDDNDEHDENDSHFTDIAESSSEDSDSSNETDEAKKLVHGKKYLVL